MIGESTVDTRADATNRVMASLAEGIERAVTDGKAEDASKFADSLTMLIIKTHEVEALGNVADSAISAARGSRRTAKKHDLGDLD